jgi:hypothetical protein
VETTGTDVQLLRKIELKNARDSVVEEGDTGNPLLTRFCELDNSQ